MAVETDPNTPTTPADEPQTFAEPTPTEPVAAQPPVDEPLGEPGKRALEAERAARKEADRLRKEAEAEAKRLREAAESEDERKTREAEEGRVLAAQGQESLRQANLILSLADQGLGAKQARAAVKLLDGIQYDGDNLPVNLDDCLIAARATYGEGVFATPASAPASPAAADLHPGARPPGDGPDEAALLAGYMSTHFPQVRTEHAGTT